ncbi:methylenetetrahydrofolate reductase [Spongisporangium articulatum]|uniref:Methylenetetrahydrofolate reductase n=1 Tax=Spongisporangium articulatum TaxID=3362603 RepID=A0ABW8ATC3_9ACTN
MNLESCPKHMEFGPCGGVTLGGECEVAPGPCVFLDADTVRWRGTPGEGTTSASSGAQRMRALLASRPVVVADFPARALDAASITECASALRGHVDAVLAGDAGNARVQFPPSYRAHLVQAAGVPVWTGFNNRDRNRVALEGELAALAHVGVAGVHCVTGDHTLTGHRPDAQPVFDLDSTRTAALARAAGHLVSVGEAPATPPVDRRPDRLLEKQRAGAELCFVNHAGGAGPVGSFIRRAQDLGVTVGFIPCIPIVLDHESAQLLRSFTSLVLPDGYLDGILSASDPRAAGIDAAAALAADFLALDGVVGVNLSGGTSPGRERWFAEGLAAVADTIGVHQPPP